MNRTFALLIPAALILGGCLNKTDIKAADDATTRFYQQVAAKQYDAIYDAAAPDLQSATHRDIFIGYMKRIDRKLGACQAAKPRMDFHINVTPAGAFRTQGYSRDCANGPLQEQVTMVIRKGVATLAGYSGNSQLLLTD
jgi:hypothetical protein